MKKRIITCIIGLLPIFIIIFNLGKNIASNIRLDNVCTKEIEASLIRVDEYYIRDDSIRRAHSYEKEYTGSYTYVINNQEYLYRKTFSDYPDKQIIIKYNPNNPSEACSNTGIKGFIIMLCIFLTLSSVIFYLFVFGNKKTEEESNKSVKSFFEKDNRKY